MGSLDEYRNDELNSSLLSLYKVNCLQTLWMGSMTLWSCIQFFTKLDEVFLKPLSRLDRVEKISCKTTWTQALKCDINKFLTPLHFWLALLFKPNCIFWKANKRCKKLSICNRMFDPCFVYNSPIIRGASSKI